MNHIYEIIQIQNFKPAAFFQTFTSLSFEKSGVK